jgi:hypothetical protein
MGIERRDEKDGDVAMFGRALKEIGNASRLGELESEIAGTWTRLGREEADDKKADAEETE